MKVSIVVITYNGERFLRQQLDTLIAQTYPIHEIIIQDDGSKDGTWDIMEEYAAKYPHIHIFHNEAEHGVNGNLYSALARATGDILSICDQDDIWEPQKIEEQVNKIGNALLIGGTTLPFSDDGSPVAVDTRPANCNLLRLIFASAVPGHSMLLRPEMLKHFKQSTYNCYDAQLQVAAAAMESLVYQGICPVHQRKHADSATYTKPVDSSRTAGNASHYLWNCIKIYHAARPVQIERMRIWHQFLKDIDIDTPSKTMGLKMTKLMMGTDIISKIRLTLFCFSHRRHLFYVKESDSLLLKVRALLYPLTSTYYYRGLTK